MSLIIIWLSANLFGYELLKQALSIKEAKIIAIVTLSDKAKTKMYDGINKDKWYKFNIPVYEIEDINKESNLLKSLKPDVIIMCGWRQIIKRKILNIPRLGVIGFHPTLLPKGRGPAPIINTILEGFNESGVTMFYITEKIDDGPIIGQSKFVIRDEDYAYDIYNKVIKAGKHLVRTYLPLLAKGKIHGSPQDETEATYFKKRSIKDNEINLEADTVDEIYRKIRAFSKPYKGAFVRFGNKKLIIWKAELRDINE